MASQSTFNPEGEIIRPQTPTDTVIMLPGQGTPGPECGHAIHMHCNHCGHRWVGERSCMGRTCPNCWRKWAAKEARCAGIRMWAGTSMIAPKRSGRRIVHAVVSFESVGTLSKDRKQAIKIAKAHGLSGGLAIFHPYRQDEDGAFIHQAHVHFHIIGLARGNISVQPIKEISVYHSEPNVIIEKKEIIYPGEDYVFKVIRDAENKDYRGFQSVSGMKACIFYLLTHCGIIDGCHALTWWGELSYNMLSNQKLFEAYPEVKREMEKVPIARCPTCGSDEVEPDWIYDSTSQIWVDCRFGAYG